MKAITIWQPWASLIACEVKRTETRSWAPPKNLIGERIAIHAAVAKPGVASPFLTTEAMGKIRRSKVYPAAMTFGYSSAFLPRGKIVCTAILDGAFKIDRHTRKGGFRYANGDCDYRGVGTSFSYEIDRWGDFSIGRWVWILTHIKVLDVPIPARGRQRFWEIDL